MKRVDPKKLLPSSVPTGGSVGAVSSSILVPASNITTKTYAKVEPEENTPQKSELRAQTFQIKSKLIEVSKLFSVKNKFTRDKNRKKRIEEERERREQREKESEKTTFKFGSGLPKLTLPRTGFLDSIKRFLLYSLLGFAVEKFLPLVPKLLEFGKMLIPAMQFLSDFAGNFLVNMVNFIDRGYKVYDGIKEQLDRIIPSDISQQFSKFSGLLNSALNAALLLGTAAIGMGGPLGKFGIGAREIGTGVAGAATAAGLYASRYTFRTVKDTTPAFASRLSNMMLRTSMGLPAAKTLPTKEALKDPAFALQYTPQKASYTSARDKAIVNSIVEGATDETTQALRRAGVGVIDDAPQRNTAKNLLRLMGFGNTVGPNEPLRPDKSKRKSPKVKVTGTKKSVKPLTSTKALGSALSSEIARQISTFKKIGYNVTDLVNVAEGFSASFGEDPIAREAAYKILLKKGYAYKVQNVPSLETILPRPADRSSPEAKAEAKARKARERAQRILEGQKFKAPSAQKPKVTRVSSTQEISKGISKFKFGKFRKAGPGIFGALLDIGISLALGEPIDRALVSAAGAGLGGWLGGIAGSVVPGIGTIIGGTLGSMLGGIVTLSLYDTIRGRDKKNLIPKPITDADREKEEERKKSFQELLMRGSAALGGSQINPPVSYNPPGPKQYYSISDLVGFALSVGFKKENAAIAAAIAMAESSGNPNAHNTTYPDNSYGLWQINMLDEPGYKLGEERRRKFNIKDNSELFDPNLNAQIAYKISGGSNFSAWTTYTGGAYKTYLGAAQEALQKISTTPTILKKKASISKPSTLNVAKGLDDQAGYDIGGYQVAILPIKQIIEKPVPIGGNGNGTFIDTTNSSNIFTPALIG